MSYTDIHFHLLPGVDDGPQTIEETIELAASAFAEGARAAPRHSPPTLTAEPVNRHSCWAATRLRWQRSAGATPIA